MAALHWRRFIQVEPSLHPFPLRLAVVFAVIGYGTKAGLAPMHTWKPDAYREAPSPAGVLMAVGMQDGAFYFPLRRAFVAQTPPGPGFPGGLSSALGPAPAAGWSPVLIVEVRPRR